MGSSDALSDYVSTHNLCPWDIWDKLDNRLNTPKGLLCSKIRSIIQKWVTVLSHRNGLSFNLRVQPRPPLPLTSHYQYYNGVKGRGGRSRWSDVHACFCVFFFRPSWRLMASTAGFDIQHFTETGSLLVKRGILKRQRVYRTPRVSDKYNSLLRNAFLARVLPCLVKRMLV